jgi:hypothetical protein
LCESDTLVRAPVIRASHPQLREPSPSPTLPPRSPRSSSSVLTSPRQLCESPAPPRPRLLCLVARRGRPPVSVANSHPRPRPHRSSRASTVSCTNPVHGPLASRPATVSCAPAQPPSVVRIRRHAPVVPGGQRQSRESPAHGSRHPGRPPSVVRTLIRGSTVPASHRQLYESAPPSSRAATVSCANPLNHAPVAPASYRQLHEHVVHGSVARRGRPPSPTCCCTGRRNKRIPRLGHDVLTDEQNPASAPPSPLLLSLHPALKFYIMIPIPFVPQGKRPTERLRNQFLSFVVDVPHPPPGQPPSVVRTTLAHASLLSASHRQLCEPPATPPSSRPATVSSANPPPRPRLRRWSGSAVTPPARQLRLRYVLNGPSSRPPNPYNRPTTRRLVSQDMRRAEEPGKPRYIPECLFPRGQYP